MERILYLLHSELYTSFVSYVSTTVTGFKVQLRLIGYGGRGMLKIDGLNAVELSPATFLSFHLIEWLSWRPNRHKENH